MMSRTTKVAAQASVAKLQSLLAAAGARTIVVEYDAGRQVSAISFDVELGSRTLSFRLPANPPGVLAALKRDPKVPRANRTIDHARKVAWRVVLTWVQAQLAIIESGQAELAEVFLPYALTGDNRTIYEMARQSPAMIGLGKDAAQ